MSKCVSLLIAIALLLILLPGAGSRANAGLLVDTSTHFIQVPASVNAQSNDKITLAATLYQPRFFPSAPAVIYVHGWGGHRLMGEDNLAYYIASAGYTVLSYTARGFGSGESGGRVTLAGPNEINDLKRVIDWLLNDPDSVIGPRVTKIGVIGGSYGGSHSFQIASDPRVAAVIPLVGWTDLESALFPNGAINYKLGLGEFYGGLDKSVGSPPFYNYDRIEFEMFDAAAEGRAPDGAVKQELRDRSIAERDENGREVLIEGRQPRAPIFIVQSWDDYLFPSTQVLDVFSQVTAPKQIYFGRRGHPPGGNESDPEEVYIAAAVLRWFNHYLLGVGGTDSKKIASAAEPSVFLPLSYSQFPPSDASTTSFYLKAGGLISRKKKGATFEERAGGIFRPQLIRSSRLGTEIPSKNDMFSATVERSGSLPRSLVYTSARFDSDTEVMGPGTFVLHVSNPAAQTFDLVARVFDVSPDGVETEVTVGVARVSGIAPGGTRRVTFRDFGDNWIFRAGHALRVKLSNIDFPDFRPPGANDNKPSDFTLLTGKKFPSQLKLVTRER
ncbi:MAG TPA: alpha/beta fold hydrolase [Blastocatellia bacterium]|nr:alpha/beta fold hydrolase [Blastocatellia bacterium]